ncbi:hypothetical protein GDO78_019694 [Eleutherodactylus coqui]|uniref:Uncharacterized protein n=1 Tax=Eleutherodactylus coqui TaxID=57060 RepID=A0A8J6BJ76_ELECQ|nr:hypothetical protein GDO78_019694 [Eleutherodactylus coqui]
MFMKFILTDSSVQITKYYFFPAAVESLTTDPAILLIVVGILMFIITFFGCLGSLRDINLLLKIFAGMLIVVLILQLVAAILGFIFRGTVSDSASSVMAKAIIYYRDDLDLQNLIDYIQKKVTLVLIFQMTRLTRTLLKFQKCLEKWL